MNVIGKFAKRGYDDKLERDAARKLFLNDKKFRKWIIDYANINSNDIPFKLIANPLKIFTKTGEPCGVDLGLIDKNGKIRCLVEVDVFFDWNPEWPSYYRWCHRLARKEKYYKDTPYPYINISFSADHKNGIMTTREIESQYPVINKFFKVKQMYERLREVPIPKAIKVGEWA
jgi:hypothetical protein|tara:strand:+ start:67 stop:585 length:519 start_codon:yes stop_codon:yes gene_type:complete